MARTDDAIAELDRGEVWITLRPPAQALADASAMADRVAAGEELPLAGLTLAVKGNIDVAGLPEAARARLAGDGRAVEILARR